jgi:hypothetical protein
MKRLAAILIAAATSAHAQFAVMHTNGVVTSPNNLTIQQSNVAGLASALDSKLGTNPTLAISNTAGLQSALDGKLATNGTLAVSNVSGLQSALDGKLATNGSAAGLSGFVGTTNAEAARGNLGISNTFAGQFHADFYDDFSRYTNGTVVGDGFVPLKGGAYTMRWGSTNYSSPLIVSNGNVAATNDEIFYLTTELNRPVYNFGGVVEWDQVAGNSAVFIIQPTNTQFFQKMLHIIVNPWFVNVDVSTNFVGGLQSIFFTNFGSPHPILPNTKQTIMGNIDNDTLYFRFGGHVYTVSHPLIPLVTGASYTFQTFSGTNNHTNRWYKVWANSPSMAQIYSQPLSEELQSLSRGYGDFSTRLIVSTNPTSFVPFLGTNTSAYFEKSIWVNGLVQGRLGTNSQRGSVPVVHQKKQGGIGNTNTTNFSVLTTFDVIPGLMADNYSRWKATAVGSFANTTNEKRLIFQMANGTHLDTGNITNTGQWILEAIVYATPTNSHEGFAILQAEGITKTARWTFNNGSDVQFGVDIEASATSNNEVILRGAWADWYP